VADLPVCTPPASSSGVDGLSSAPDTVVVSSLKRRPVADAAPIGALCRDVVTLNGSMSRDPDLDPLAFSMDAGHARQGAQPSSRARRRLPDLHPGRSRSYTGTLTVKDPFGAVATDSVVVSVVTGAQLPRTKP